MHQLGNCPIYVMMMLFKSCSLTMYGVVLWHEYLTGNIQKLHSCHNWFLKMFCGHNAQHF